MKNHYTLVMIAILFSIISCKKPSESIQPVDYNPLKKSVVAQYSVVVHNTYKDAVTNAVIFSGLVKEFVDSPTETEFIALKNYYGSKLREPYNQSDAFRFYGGPIDNELTGKEGQMNGWPLDESYIDYVLDENGKTIDSGIVGNAKLLPNITAEALAEMNGVAAETALTSGFHAIEFLLWGQDLYQSSPGKRPYTDYVLGSGSTSKNQARRGQYLKAVTALLVSDLQFTLNAWLPSANNYRAMFESQNPDISIELLLTGLGKFTKGELFGERSLTFYGNYNQEDEHSCFSDLTTKDLQKGQQGIINVYYGKYTATDGTVTDGVGLDELVEAVNKDLNAKTKADLANTLLETNAIPAPFDNNTPTINATGHAQIKKAIDSGYKQADDFVNIASALKLRLAL